MIRLLLALLLTLTVSGPINSAMADPEPDDPPGYPDCPWHCQSHGGQC